MKKYLQLYISNVDYLANEPLSWTTPVRLFALFFGLALALAVNTCEAAKPSTKAQPSSIKAKVKAVKKKSLRARRAVAAPAVLGGDPALRSASVLVIDQEQGEELYAKNPAAVMPIASITKLMTAMVILDAKLPLDETITIESADVDVVRNSGSKLRVGTRLLRRDLLLLALMASENRAAAALGRTYPGGINVFVEAMNAKAKLLAMDDTRFVDPTGLRSENVSTAQDLAKLVVAAHDYELIREQSTTPAYRVNGVGRFGLAFRNTNGLVKSNGWKIGLSKTGFIRESGRCLVMQATIGEKPVVIVLLDSWGKQTRIGDANRIKTWIEKSPQFRS
jgi:D-alanyl-D-alanine endopeptidase (penicillin-binding protein 7)